MIMCPLYELGLAVVVLEIYNGCKARYKTS